MSTASSHSPTELKDGKEGRGLSASAMDELRVLKMRKWGWDIIHWQRLRKALYLLSLKRSHASTPARQRGGTNSIRGANTLAEGWVDLAEAGPLRPLFLPTIQHQLMEMWRTVDWRWQPETVLDGLYHLHRETGNQLESVRKRVSTLCLSIRQRYMKPKAVYTTQEVSL